MLRSTTVKDILKEVIQRLAEAGCDTPQLDAEVLLAYTLNKDRTQLYLYPEARLDQNQRDNFFKLIARRERREPVAYIVGRKEFFGLEFLVNPNVLIPRPETELLVETAMDIVNNNLENRFVKSKIQNPKSKITIIDVGTGSGCIAVSLAKHLANVQLFAIDISHQALEVARQNAARHQVSNRITFLAGDLSAPLTMPVDMIVSNPPYVSQAELTAPATMPEVSQYEPRLALDGGRDGLEIIGKLLPLAAKKLKSGGSLLVEIGFGQGQAVMQLAKTHFPAANVQIKPDLAGLDRLLVVENIK